MLVMGAGGRHAPRHAGAQPACRSLHHPLFDKKRFALVSRDKFILVIGAQDEKFCATETTKLLAAIGGKQIEIVEDVD